MHGREVRIQGGEKERTEDGTIKESKIRGVKETERNMKENEAEKPERDVKGMGGQGGEERRCRPWAFTESTLPETLLNSTISRASQAINRLTFPIPRCQSASQDSTAGETKQFKL